MDMSQITRAMGSFLSVWPQSRAPAYRMQRPNTPPKPIGPRVGCCSPVVGYADQRCRDILSARIDADGILSDRAQPAYQKVLERNPEEVSDRGSGVGAGVRPLKRGRTQGKGTATVKLTTMTQVTVDGVMQGNGGASDEDRRNGFERGGWALGMGDNETMTFINQTYQHADAFLFGLVDLRALCRYWGAEEARPRRPRKIRAATRSQLP